MRILGTGVYYAPDDNANGSGNAGGANGTQGDPTNGGKTETPTDNGGKQGDKPEDGKSKVVFTPEQQAALNEMMGKARQEGRESATKELEEKRKAEQEEADRKAAEQKGEWEKLAREEKKAREQAEAKLKETEENAKRLEIAAKHKLPEGWHKRLQGTTPEEWEADAKAIAKDVAAPKAPNMEGGSQNRTTQAEVEKAVMDSTRANARYTSL